MYAYFALIFFEDRSFLIVRERITKMRQLLKNANVYGKGKADILISDLFIVEISSNIDENKADIVYDLSNMHIFPGFVDVHVHLREPGFSYKETILSGTRAAAHGGYSDICTMPNLNPVPDNLENLKAQTDIIKRDAVVNVHPYGAITVAEKGEELSDMSAMAETVIAFSDDGRGVQNDDIMKSAMISARSLGKIIAAHCEDNSLLNGGYIHDGRYAQLHNHKGICSESEWRQISRDLDLAAQTGCSYHVCHISSQRSVELIRNAKAHGIDVTCETAPHYLVFDDEDLQEDGRFKMNPPIRSKEDKDALIKGLIDGTIDMIATDHAPHSAEEKSGGLKGSLNGIVGLETAFAVLYTELVKKNIITLDRLIELMSTNPAKRFSIPSGIDVGKKANLTAFNLDEEYTINLDEFLSMGKSSPFDKKRVFGRCVLTAANGNIISFNKGDF